MRSDLYFGIPCITLALMLVACSWHNIHPYRGLPHRPMSEIDVQGHLEYIPHRACEAQYDAPDGNLRFCG